MSRPQGSKTVRKKAQPSRFNMAKLEAMIEDATVDCHDESEQASGFFTMIEENLAVPFETSVLGVSVTVDRVELSHHGQIVAICVCGRNLQALPLLDLPLPMPRPKGAEWIDAYRHWLGG